jgi:hypothetical protein
MFLKTAPMTALADVTPTRDDVTLMLGDVTPTHDDVTLTPTSMSTSSEWRKS